jgi:hypothetical protein
MALCFPLRKRYASPERVVDDRRLACGTPRFSKQDVGEIMGRINVAFDGKPLFEWEGTTEDLDRMEAPLKRLAEAGHTTVGTFTTSAVILIARHGGFFTQNQQSEMMATIYFLLNQSTEHPDHPGHYRDYLETWDFDFNFHDFDEARKRFSVEVEGALGDNKEIWPRIN